VLEDPRSVALGNEPVLVGGAVRGRVTSGGYGYTVERSIAYAYLPPEVEIGTAVEVDIFGRLVPGEIAREPPVRSGRRAGAEPARARAREDAGESRALDT
jgi:glycine cleavage system aminomethyltransferase T